MKCMLCNDRNGSTRCEGCQQLYCLPCMNRHHESLAEDFQLLTHNRNELRESLNIMKSTSGNDQVSLIIKDIDRWEKKTIENIQNLATQMRHDAQEIVTKKLNELDYEFNNLTKDIQRREKEGNYLESDILMIKTQLEQLKNQTEKMNKYIYLDTTTSKNIPWNTLIRIGNKYSEQKEIENTSEVKSDEYQQLSEKPIRMVNTDSALKNSVDFNRPSDRLRVQHQQSAESPVVVQNIDTPRKYSLDLNRPTDRIHQCITCKRYFDRISSKGLCAGCDFKNKYQAYQNIAQQTPQKYVQASPAYPNANNIPRQQIPSGYRGPIKVTCNHCRHVNVIPNPKVKSACSKCRAYLNVPHY